MTKIQRQGDRPPRWPTSAMARARSPVFIRLWGSNHIWLLTSKGTGKGCSSVQDSDSQSKLRSGIYCWKIQNLVVLAISSWHWIKVRPTIPGNKPPSARPRIERRLTNWEKLWINPIHMHIKPHKKAMTPIHIRGVTFLKMRLLGISLDVTISVYARAV